MHIHFSTNFKEIYNNVQVKLPTLPHKCWQTYTLILPLGSCCSLEEYTHLIFWCKKNIISNWLSISETKKIWRFSLNKGWSWKQEGLVYVGKCYTCAKQIVQVYFTNFYWHSYVGQGCEMVWSLINTVVSAQAPSVDRYTRKSALLLG